MLVLRLRLVLVLRLRHTKELYKSDKSYYSFQTNYSNPPHESSADIYKNRENLSNPPKLVSI